MKQIRNMPSTNQIAKYWASRLMESKPIFAAFGEATSCMACQCPSITIERAHIKAKSTGGSDTVENLHNLCHACHGASEMKDGDSYWGWFYTRSPIDSCVTLMMRSGMTFHEVNERLEEMRQQANREWHEAVAA